MNGGDRLAKPGRLSYRAGTYRSFLAEMLGRARRKPPLATLNVRTESDFTVALMGGWAQVCDVLTFYQERIANEGYLPTAVETLSILHLVDQIGERRRPALGAETRLSVQLLAAAGQPDSVSIEPGPSLAVQNAPASPDALPVVFESRDRIVLRAAWNALAPVVPPITLAPALWTGARSLRLVGTSTGLRPGFALVLQTAVGDEWLVIVDTVQVDRTLGATLVTWIDPLPEVEGRVAIAAIVQFDRSAGLFGRTAMDWSDVDESQKESIGVRAGGILILDHRGLSSNAAALGEPLWRVPPDSQPPPAGIQALLDAGGGNLLAGTDLGLFRSTDLGATWQALTLGRRRHAVRALHRDPTATLYAGTEDGWLFTSPDGGAAWTPLPRTVLHQPSGPSGSLLNIFGGTQTAAPSSWMLAGPIRSIQAVPVASGPPSDIYIGTEQGVLAMLGNAPQWTPFNTGLPGLNSETGAADILVSALAVSAGQFLYAATNRGVFVTPLREAQWTRAAETGPLDCTCLAVPADRVFVGTSAGIFLLSSVEGGIAFNVGLGEPPPAIRSLALVGNRLFAATSAGIFGSGIDAADWQSLDVQDLALFTIDPVFAGDPGDPEGLDAGKVSIPLRRRFERFGITLVDDVEVTALRPPRSGDGPAAGWQLREAAPSARIFRIYRATPLRVTQLVRNLADPLDRLVAADAGLTASLPLGPVLNQEWPDFAIQTGETRLELAGGTGTVSGAELFLDRRIDDVETGSVVVLAPAGTSLQSLAPAGPGLDPRPRLHKVKASDAVLRKAFGKQSTVSEIVVDATPELLASDLRTTNVYLVSHAVAPFTATIPDLAPLSGDRLTITGVFADLGKGRTIEVTGPRPAAALLPAVADPQAPAVEKAVAVAGVDAGPALDQQTVSPDLRSVFAAAGIKLSAEPAVFVARPGARWLVRDGDSAWRLELAVGSTEPRPIAIVAATLYEVVAPLDPPATGWTLARGDTMIDVPDGSGEIVWQEATSSQAAYSEIAVIEEAAVRIEADATEIRLSAPLSGLYDAAQCRICANVVRMTQGQTVQGEVLGSGQPSQAGQKFALHNAPLTYDAGPHGAGIRPQLKVEVNSDAMRARHFGAGGLAPAPPGELWREVRSLALAGPGQRVYMVTTDESGRATLRFGDGLHGARLPSGSDNVSATYRYGAGAAGNVAAGSLVALRSRPTGIRSAVNPVAATGGKDAESISWLRRRAPLHLECLGRIVTLDDYAVFARDFPGVGRAQAALFAQSGRPAVVVLTIVTDSWQPISQAPELARALRDAIERGRADRLELRLGDPLILAFGAALAVTLASGAEAAVVAGAARAALAAAFGPARRDFAQPVYPEEVLAALAGVPGLAEARLDALGLAGAPVAAAAPLLAARARPGPDGGAPLPAEWLLLDEAALVVTVAP